MQLKSFLLLLIFLASTSLIYSLYRAGESKERSLQPTTETTQSFQLSLEYLSGKSEKEIKEWYARNKTISVTYQDSSAKARIDSVLTLVEEAYPFLKHSFY